MFVFFYHKDQNFDIIKIEKFFFAKNLTKKDISIKDFFNIILLIMFYLIDQNFALNRLYIKKFNYS